MVRRNTNQRQIVYQSLEYLGHASSENLIRYIQENYSDISLATIYRNLDVLMNEHKVKKVKLKEEDVYETIKEHHYHYVCRNCGMITDVLPQEIGFKLPKLELKDGSRIEEYDFAFYGICHKCQQQN